MTEPITLDINAIMERIPHRFPFLLVDRVLELVPSQHLRALKNVTVNEPYFPGHFPHRPVMPGVIIIEALAQAAGILAFVSAGVAATPETRFYFAAIDGARFRRPVEPGDQLILHAKLERNLRGIMKFSAQATVDGNEACSAELMLAADTANARRVGNPA